MTKKKVSGIQSAVKAPREYVDPRMVKATLILRDMLSSLRPTRSAQ